MLQIMFKDAGRAADIYGRVVRNIVTGIPVLSRLFKSCSTKQMQLSSPAGWHVTVVLWPDLVTLKQASTGNLSPLKGGEWSMAFISSRWKLNTTCEQQAWNCLRKGDEIHLNLLEWKVLTVQDHPSQTFQVLKRQSFFHSGIVNGGFFNHLQDCDINLKHLIELLTYIWKSAEHIFCGKAFQSDWFVSL